MTGGGDVEDASGEGPAVPVAVVQRVLPAPPDVVFEAWLDAQTMGEWMCPRPARPTRIDLDPRVGGRFRIDVDDDDGFSLSITGEYLELNRPHRISFTWHCSNWEPSDPASVVTVTFEPHGDGLSVMTIRHAQLPPTVVEGHRHGWTVIGRRLEEQLEGSPR